VQVEGQEKRSEGQPLDDQGAEHHRKRREHDQVPKSEGRLSGPLATSQCATP
jgi:hypothetical protein